MRNRGLLVRSWIGGIKELEIEVILPALCPDSSTVQLGKCVHLPKEL